MKRILLLVKGRNPRLIPRYHLARNALQQSTVSETVSGGVTDTDSKPPSMIDAFTFELPVPPELGVIPKQIFQTWKTKDLPPGMLAAVSSLKAANPDFKHYLYDNSDCLEFLERNFPIQIVCAYESLVPGAYKADLWRYCVLYYYGGVYLDIKFQPVNGFSLKSFVDRESYCRDREFVRTSDGAAVYNAFIVAAAGSPILAKCIRQVVNNVRFQYYGLTPINPTGPQLMAPFVTDNLFRTKYSDCGFKIQHMNNEPIFEAYATYRTDQKVSFARSNLKHYHPMWEEKNIYLPYPIYRVTDLPDPPQRGIIPKKIFQTWQTKNLPPGMNAAVNTMKDSNPDFEHFLFDEDDRLSFLKKYFTPEVVYTYEKLIPGAYKADLWRYCVLYYYGGVYIDIKFVPLNGFSLASHCSKEHYCLDWEGSWLPGKHGVANGFIIAEAGSIIMANCIKQVIINVKNEFYGVSSLQPTGPLLLAQFVPKDKCSFINTFNKLELNNQVVLDTYPGYREEQFKTTMHYSRFHTNRNIYKQSNIVSCANSSQ